MIEPGSLVVMTDDVKSFFLFPRGRSIVFPPGTLLSVIAFLPKEESPEAEEMIILQLIKMNSIEVISTDDTVKQNTKVFKSRLYEQGTIVFRIAADASEGLKQVPQ